jgi:rod shape determining protein RodA
MNDTLDRPLFFITVFLAMTGVVMIYSATHNASGIGTSQYMMQSIWFGTGLIVMYLTYLLPLRFLQAVTVPLFILVIILLIAVLATGTIKGSSRWIRFGAIGIQPSELAKIAVILILAQYLEPPRRNIRRPLVLFTACILVGLPVVLILKQPDLGTSLVFGAILCGMLLWAGLSIFELVLFISPVIGILIAVISGFNWIVWAIFMLTLIGIMYIKRPPISLIVALIVIQIGVGLTAEPLWDSLHDYQRQRVETFLKPQEDALGAGYQIIQSQIAIGSGGMFGRGLLQGSQTQLAFLPEQQTDFIFSVIGEELGFVGSVSVLILFYVLIIRGIKIAVNVKGSFQSLIAAGCVSVFSFHVIMNVGMTIGLLPVAGVPLPFLSYGGSFLMTSMILSGLLLNAWRHRYEY